MNQKREEAMKNTSVPGKTTRKPQFINDISLNMCLINCRSLKPKLNSLVECFKMNNLSVSLLNETWLYKSDSQAKHLLKQISLDHKIEIIRKDRNSRGGGVAIAFNSDKISLKKLDLAVLKTKNHLEIVAARGKIKGYKKDVTFFSCYLPPKYTKAESSDMLDALSEAIAESKKSSEGWIIVGGDWNNRPLNEALIMYPDIKILNTEPTRKDRTLDIIATNCLAYLIKSQVCHPLEGEYGQISDHKLVLAEFKLPRPRAFTWEVHEYLQITEIGKKEFIDRVNAIDWKDLSELWPNQDAMANVFTETLQDILHSCFKWKRVRRKSTDKPWISDALSCLLYTSPSPRDRQKSRMPSSA